MKNILITGANRGLGLGFAKKCLKKNVHVLATVRDIKGSKELLALKERFPDNLQIFELDLLKKSIEQYENLDIYIKRLYEINGEIWDLESDIRKGKEGELGLEEVGRRAIAIRSFNNIRVSLKNEINNKFNSGYKETKVDHASS